MNMLAGVGLGFISSDDLQILLRSSWIRVVNNKTRSKVWLKLSVQLSLVKM